MAVLQGAWASVSWICNRWSRDKSAEKATLSKKISPLGSDSIQLDSSWRKPAEGILSGWLWHVAFPACFGVSKGTFHYYKMSANMCSSSGPVINICLLVAGDCWGVALSLWDLVGFKEILQMQRFYPKKTQEWLCFSAKYDSVGGKVLWSNVCFTEVLLRPAEQRSRTWYLMAAGEGVSFLLSGGFSGNKNPLTLVQNKYNTPLGKKKTLFTVMLIH